MTTNQHKAIDSTAQDNGNNIYLENHIKYNNIDIFFSECIVKIKHFSKMHLGIMMVYSKLKPIDW